MNIVKKQTVFGWTALASAVLALVAFVFYVVTSTTGYLKGTVMNGWPIALTLVSAVVLVALFLYSEKLDSRIVGGILFAVAVLLGISMCMFIMGRLQLFADVYFIPVNYPVSEVTSLTVSIVGIAFYLAAIIAVTVSGFGKSLSKAEN